LDLVAALITRSYGNLEELIGGFCEGFDVDPTFVLGIVALAKH